jgi:probable rRNA maturation factor
MKLTIVNQSGRAVPRQFLEEWARALVKLASRERGFSRAQVKRFAKRELVVAFVSTKEARRLNKTYRGKDYATDVLSFDGSESGDESGDESLGELVICPEVISRQAREHGLLVREELGYMVLHGVLHLLGFDHERGKAEATRMFELQDRLFEQLLSRQD